MYPILTASLLVRYIVDSFLFKKQLENENSQKNIPVYTIEMQQTFSETLPFAWLFHLCIGYWMYWVNHIGMGQEMVEVESNWMNLVLQGLGMGLFIILLLYYLVNDSLLHIISCGFHRRKRRRHDRKLDLSNMLTYTEALENNILGTYSMLDLPKYRQKLDSIAALASLDKKRERERGNTELSHVIDVFLSSSEKEKEEKNR